MTSQVRLRSALNIEIGVEGGTGQNDFLPLAHIHMFGIGRGNCRLNNTVNRVKLSCHPIFLLLLDRLGCRTNGVVAIQRYMLQHARV